MSVLHNFMTTSNDIEKLRELLKRGENPNNQTILGTPLTFAITKCENNLQETDDILQVARELINSGANVDLADYGGYTPLHTAVRFINYKMTKLLLELNAQINIQDKFGNAVLHHATYGKFNDVCDHNKILEIVKLLLEYNPDLDLQNYYGQTPLMLAAESTNIQIVRELLKNNASVTLQDSKGHTAMFYALSQRDVDANMVLELLRHGCSFNMNNDFMISFILKFRYKSLALVEEVKRVFKLFAFDRYHCSYQQLKGIIELSKGQNVEISKFLELCEKEIEQMGLDQLAPNYTFYDITLFSLLSRNFENYAFGISPGVIYKVIDKVIRGQYPLYCDIVVSGVCSPYMNIRFAEVCCKTGGKFLNYDGFYSLSFYLSELDMLNTMIACSG